VARWRPKARLAAVAQFIARVALEGRTLVVTNKPVRCALTGENPTNLPVAGKYGGADIAHFGGIRGTNDFEDRDAVIIVGREQPSVRDAERRAMAIWYDTRRSIYCVPADKKGNVQYTETHRSYRMRDGTRKFAKVKVHPDRRVQAVVEQIREAEMVQAIDRLRLIHTQREKTVYIMCNIPLDPPVDALVTWPELVGDGRLEVAMEECEEKGWDALPLAAKQLQRLFANLWATETAAKRWIEKNPPKAYRDIIRVWGVLNDYRPPSQTSWSKALVRHGADPQMALAAVLGVAAEDIRVKKEAAGSEPPVKANTAPMPRPNKPSPTTGPVAQPSNGGPD